jgi:HTH-type transcriptional regulator/antitoxin HigA
MSLVQFNHILHPYNELLKQAPFLIKIKDEEGYHDALTFVDLFMEEVGDNPTDFRWPLFEMVSQAIARYEAAIYPERVTELDNHQGALSTLRILMDQYQLNLSDLPELGSPAQVSEMLVGELELTDEHIHCLANRFQIPISMFIS